MNWQNFRVRKQVKNELPIVTKRLKFCVSREQEQRVADGENTSESQIDN